MVASTSSFLGLDAKFSLKSAAVTATFFLNCIGGKGFVRTKRKRLSRKLLNNVGRAKIENGQDKTRVKYVISNRVISFTVPIRPPQRQTPRPRSQRSSPLYRARCDKVQTASGWRRAIRRAIRPDYRPRAIQPRPKDSS